VTDWAPGQEQAFEQLMQISASRPGAVVIERIAAELQQGWLPLEISIGCTNQPTGLGGVQLEPREPLVVYVPRDFPFIPPQASVRHRRFAELPHVMWGQHLCVYQSPNDWDPGSGMFGFLSRLAAWYRRAAEGTLEIPGQPLHPPVIYQSSLAGCVVASVNLPDMAKDAVWLGSAIMVQPHPDRVDIVDWLDQGDLFQEESSLDDLQRRLEVVAGLQRLQPFLAPTIVLTRQLNFEFPRTLADLVAALADRGVPREEFILLLTAIAQINSSIAASPDQVTPLYSVIGAPMRGIAGDTQRLTHLAVWKLSTPHAIMAANLLSLADARTSDFTSFIRPVMETARPWINTARLTWARVYEQRPEIVIRRDADRSAKWLRGRRVLVLGCGALGARVAEHCLRSGAAKITVADQARINPGVLVRQPYTDDDIGFGKSAVLARRLHAIKPDASIHELPGDILETLFRERGAVPEADLVIDATASRTISAMIEWQRWTSAAPWPPILTIAVGHDCQLGVAALALPAATGGAADIFHRLALAALATPPLKDVADDFFPNPGSRNLFQPELGCSDPTFTGADAEAAALAAQLFAWGIGRIHANDSGDLFPAKSLYVARLPGDSTSPAISSLLEWDNDVTLLDTRSGYQIRIQPEVLAAMRSEARRSAQRFGWLFETGGILLGRIDDACRVIWVTAAEGPSVDSQSAPHYFRHGLVGVEECIAAHRVMAGERAHFVGMWHTHPGMLAAPSRTDVTAMGVLLVPARKAPPRAVIIVLGGRPGTWNSWLEEGAVPDIYGQLCKRAQSTDPRPAIALPSAAIS
jgi:proteasome lid subunit RPN8/RPN11